MKPELGQLLVSILYIFIDLLYICTGSDIAHPGGGVDYSPVTATLQFNSTTSMDCVRVPIVNNTILEDDEDFFGTLNCTDPSVIVSPDTARILIQDNNCEFSMLQ